MKNVHISGSTVESFLQFVFILWQAKGHRNMLKLSCRPFAFILYKAFSKNRKSLELVSLPHFLHVSGRKMFLWLYSIT